MNWRAGPRLPFCAACQAARYSGICASTWELGSRTGGRGGRPRSSGRATAAPGRSRGRVSRARSNSDRAASHSQSYCRRTTPSARWPAGRIGVERHGMLRRIAGFGHRLVGSERFGLHAIGLGDRRPGPGRPRNRDRPRWRDRNRGWHLPVVDAETATGRRGNSDTPRDWCHAAQPWTFRASGMRAMERATSRGRKPASCSWPGEGLRPVAMAVRPAG